MKKYYWIGGIVVILVVLYFILKNPKYGGINILNKAEKIGKYKYFDLREFDSPDAPGSGKNMDPTFMKMLDKTREIAGVPFFINSGYRTAAHNRKVGGVPGSAHTLGKAADIRAPLEYLQKEISKAAIKAGFKRVGIANSFVHLDNDDSKPQPAAWGYPSGPAPFNPFNLA